VAKYAQEAKQSKRAKEHFRKAMSLHPGFVACIISYANLLLLKGKAKKALLLVKAMHAQFPDSMELTFASALYHVHTVWRGNVRDGAYSNGGNMTG